MTVLSPAAAGSGPVPHGLQLADLILVAPVNPQPLDGLIVSGQSLIYPSDDAAFVHVGIYDGNGGIFDATPAHDVAHRPFHDFSAGCYLRALRVRGIGPGVQWDVCAAAQRLTGRYNYVGAVADTLIAAMPWLQAHWKQALGLASSAHFNSKQLRYCGQFVNEALIQGAMGLSVMDAKSFVPLPAAFSASPLFDEVLIHW